MALSDFVSMWEAGGQAGREARTRRTLADYAQPALQGDQKALGQIYSVDPDIGYKVQGMAREQRQQDYGDMVRAAQFYAQTGDKNAYAVLRQQAARLGPQFAGLPETIDTEEDMAGSMKFAAALVDNFGPEPNAQVREFRSMTQAAGLSDEEQQQAARIELGLAPRAVSSGMQVKQGRDGNWYAVNPAQGSATPIMVGGQPQPQQLQFTAQDGTPVSIDPSLPPHVQQSIMQSEGQWAQAPQGATAQLPPAVAQPQPFGAPQRQPAASRSSTAGQKAPTGYRFRPDGNLEPIPGGPADRPQAAPQARQPQPRQTAAQAQRIPEINDVERGIDRIDAALRALEDNPLFDGGPLDARVLAGTKEGQDLIAAVGAIQNSMSSLTRVPGMGSQSDLEAKLASLRFPSLEMNPQTNRATLEGLRQFVADLRASRGLAPATQQRPAQRPQPAPQPRRPVLPSEAAVQRVRFNPETGEIE